MTFWGKSIANFAVFLYYSLEIKFVPFLKSEQATIPGKRKLIELATKLLLKRKAKYERAREKDRNRF